MIPVPSRWTKLYACMDVFILGMMCGSMLGHIILLAWGTMLDEAAIASLFDEDDIDANLVDNGRENYAMGRRKSRVKDMINTRLLRCKLLLFWIRSIPIRFMARYLLNSSKERTPFTKSGNSESQYPPMCDLTNHSYSPIIVALQFYSYVLTKTSVWFVLLAHYTAADANLEAFKHCIRRNIGQAAAEFHRRHAYRFGRWPFLSARLVDNRLSEDARLLTAYDYFDTKECCHDKGMTTRLPKIFNIKEPGDLLQTSILIALAAIWWAAQLCTALVECEHARNRNLLHFLNSWSFFVAKALHADSKAFLKQKEEKPTVTKLGKRTSITVNKDGIQSHNAVLKQVSYHTSAQLCHAICLCLSVGCGQSVDCFWSSFACVCVFLSHGSD